MKQLLLSLFVFIVFSCNDAGKKTDTGTPVKENAETNDNVSGTTKDKEDFILTCHIDASNSLGGENVEQVNQFCECAWEKTKGKYIGEIIATRSKLEKDPELKECYEKAQRK